MEELQKQKKENIRLQEDKENLMGFIEEIEERNSYFKEALRNKYHDEAILY